jgi:Flp pilus assembly protein TadG
MRNLLTRFAKSQRGAIALMFGLLLVPILAFMGMAIDYSRSFGVRTEIQGIIDATALAVAASTNLTESERVELGQKTFAAIWSNKASTSAPTPNISINYDTTPGEDTVTVSAVSSVETVILSIMKIDQIDVGATSMAVTVKASPICLLALNKTAERAIDIQGGATLASVGCAVHANSSDEDALYASGTSSATAEQFCAVGGYEGNNFTPKPKNCGYVEDPYKDIFAPSTSGCDYNNTKIKKQDGPTTLSPGVYCGGIDVQTQANVTFNSGLYVIKNGALSLSSGSTVTGNGVTFYFTGINTRLTVISSATVDLTAPTSGTYEGFVFIQDPLSNPGQITGQKNEIQGGGSIQIVGTIYFPTQPITISGNGGFGINSPMMPIIADTITVTGNGVKTIQVDQSSANMLQDLPKSIDGARLIN